jgi:hypothetical protein
MTPRPGAAPAAIAGRSVNINTNNNRRQVL